MNPEQLFLICIITAGVIAGLVWSILEIRDINSKLNVILGSLHDRIQKLEKANDINRP